MGNISIKIMTVLMQKIMSIVIIIIIEMNIDDVNY